MSLFFLIPYFNNIYVIYKMEDNKPYWEIIYDKYLENKDILMKVCILGSLVSMSFKIYKLQKTNNLLQTQLNTIQPQLDDLKINTSLLIQTIKQIDKDNKDIAMWFAASPKLNKPRKIK